MLHFTMTMPLYLMMISGSILLLTVLILRFLLKKRLPGYFFPILWGMVLLRFLVPFSLSSPLSLKLFSLPVPYYNYTEVTASEDRLSLMTSVAEEEGTSVSDAMAVPGVPAVSAVEESTGLSITAPSLYGSVFSRSQISAVYLLGIVVTAGILLLQKYRCHRKLKNSLLIEHNETINAILREMEMAHVLVYSNDEIASPLVCGLLMPHIYLPTRIDFRNQELLRHILAHETMHIKRRDNWMKTVMLATLCLNWFNPLVWVMAGCLASDLETACDEAVLRTCRNEEDRKSYAFSLLAMAVTPRRSLLLYSAFSRTEVEKRIQ
ncbi:MAG: M56 family metallopeptidase, partial [Lachnospiraceae bacterium]|nr:M56 family metallopeptidase [Lachnospiraceae bacterium]